ncbi:MAG TPA: MarR family transcriptional regulator [Candidatus Barnesiella excrementigallinarum]|nr:MarR family transcriptional regulator [Candidatus Barnesiella excrementigallinarum]
MNFSELNIEMVFALMSGKLSAAINRKLYRSFRKMSIDITPEQWTVLCYLWSRDGVTQQELCNATFKDKPSMTRLIDNLEKQQLVVRSSGVKDRRINLIHLTDKGRELEMETKPLVTAVMREALEGFSDKEVEIAGEMFSKVFGNLKNSLDD